MIRFSCSCGRGLKAKPELSGQRARCLDCGKILEIPSINPLTDCPHCFKTIDPPPERSRKCPHCREQIVMRLKHLRTPEQAKAPDEARRAESKRKHEEFQESQRLHVESRPRVQRLIDDNQPCPERDARLFLRYIEFASDDQKERAIRLICTGEFEEGKSQPEAPELYGWFLTKSFFPGISHSSITGSDEYRRPEPDGAYVVYLRDERVPPQPRPFGDWHN